jgi:hypothetical protein
MKRSRGFCTRLAGVSLRNRAKTMRDWVVGIVSSRGLLASILTVFIWHSYAVFGADSQLDGVSELSGSAKHYTECGYK